MKIARLLTDYGVYKDEVEHAPESVLVDRQQHFDAEIRPYSAFAGICSVACLMLMLTGAALLSFGTKSMASQTEFKTSTILLCMLPAALGLVCAFSALVELAYRRFRRAPIMRHRALFGKTVHSQVAASDSIPMSAISTSSFKDDDF